MAYDDELAERTRHALSDRTEFIEKKMFGGLAFMVNTHMACGVMGEDLMVRVGKGNQPAALARGAREMDFTGRPMSSMVVVPGSQLAVPAVLEEWVENAVDFARSEPPKEPSPKTRASKTRASSTRAPEERGKTGNPDG